MPSGGGHAPLPSTAPQGRWLGQIQVPSVKSYSDILSSPPRPYTRGLDRWDQEAGSWVMTPLTWSL